MIHGSFFLVIFLVFQVDGSNVRCGPLFLEAAAATATSTPNGHVINALFTAEE
jgi:hypothetical protein